MKKLILTTVIAAFTLLTSLVYAQQGMKAKI